MEFGHCQSDTPKDAAWCGIFLFRFVPEFLKTFLKTFLNQGA